MAKLSIKPSLVEVGAPVTIILGSRKLQGSVRAIGDVAPMPAPGALAEVHFRQVVVDLDGASPPVEVWLADEESER